MSLKVAATRGKGHFDPDTLAANLIHAAGTARTMSPAWDGCRASIPYVSPNGGTMGRLLPGRGLYLFHDLKTLGITRRIPGIFEPSPVQRLIDRFGDGIAWDPSRRGLGRAHKIRYDERRGLVDAERGAISTWDGVINARGAQGKQSDSQLSTTSYTTVANTWSSVFQAATTNGTGAYTNIPTGSAPDRSAAGAWSLGLLNPSGSDKSYLLTLGYSAAQQINAFMLIDLLVGCGNITTNVTTGAQTVSSAAITRNYTPGTTAFGFIIFDITTALGATPANVTVNSYTDQAGTTGQTTAAIALLASGIKQRLTPVANNVMIQLAAGDWGVRAVSQVTVSALMGAGVIALNIYWPICYLPGLAANSYLETPPSAFSYFTELANASQVIGCLTAYVLTNTTSTGVIQAFLRTCQG